MLLCIVFYYCSFLYLSAHVLRLLEKKSWQRPESLRSVGLCFGSGIQSHEEPDGFLEASKLLKNVGTLLRSCYNASRRKPEEAQLNLTACGSTGKLHNPFKSCAFHKRKIFMWPIGIPQSVFIYLSQS